MYWPLWDASHGRPAVHVLLYLKPSTPYPNPDCHVCRPQLQTPNPTIMSAGFNCVPKTLPSCLQASILYPKPCRHVCRPDFCAANPQTLLSAGPDAPLVLERGLSSCHMEHVYDFYKPAGLFPKASIIAHPHHDFVCQGLRCS